MNSLRCILIGLVVFFLGMPAHANVQSGLRQKTLSPSLLQKMYPKTQKNSRYFPDRVIVKLRSMPVVSPKTKSSFGLPSLDKFVERYSAESIEEVFPHHALPAS